MDLQSILNDSDSSIEAGVDFTTVSNGRDDEFDGSSNYDIEEILREVDDDNDFELNEGTDDDDDDDDLEQPGWKYKTTGLAQDHDTIVLNATKRTVETKGNHERDLGARHLNRGYVSSHNPEDWAVLQQILNDDDEEDDDVDEWINTMSKYSSPLFDDTRTEDDDLVHQSSSDDEPEQPMQVPPSTHTKALLPPSTTAKADFLPDVRPTRLPVDEGIRRNSRDFEDEKKSTGSYQLPSLFEKKESVFRNSKQMRSLTIVDKVEDQSARDEEIYRQSMTNAQANERRLLKSGHREIVSPLMIKRRLKPKIELKARFARQRQLNHSLSNCVSSPKNTRITSIAGPRFGFSGLVETKAMAGVSASLVKHSIPGATKVACGLPTCLAFNSKFIAVGTQLGIILIFDLFEVLRQRLGATSYDDNALDRSTGSITSVDLSHNGDTVFAGYTSGILVLWDTIRGTILRTVTDAHLSPVTAVRFVSELKMVTVDSGGLVYKLTFTKNLIWSTYSVETDCLLDGTAGQILAMNVLPPYSTVKPLVRPDAFAKIFRHLNLIALSSERSSFTVAVDPKINVLHRWGRPPDDSTKIIGSNGGDYTDKSYLPCLSWGWALISGGGNVVMPVLARGWGCCVQLLCASFPTLDDNIPVKIGEEPVIHWPAFGIHQEIDAVAPVIALEWLNDRSLAFLTAPYEFTLVDTVMMTMQERLDFSGLKLVYAEFSLSRAASRANEMGLSVSPCTTFLNSTRCSDDRIMVICQDELRCISIIGARRRISALEADGEWLEALAFALDHYENTVISQEDRRRDPQARRDLSRHPEFSVAKSDEEEWIAKLLIRYLNLAVENAPEVDDHSSPYSGAGTTNRIDLAHSHFQMLAGVCVEFCVATRRLDLLFGSIFRRFQSVGFVTVFLDVLEPYVLNDKLKYIAPEVMSFFVDHCKATNGIATVERCLLHMDCTIMDFDSILSLLRQNEMYSALFYVFNQGLDDFVAPLEILLERVFSEADAGGTSRLNRKDGSPRDDFECLGYKALLYLQTCFAGKTFPQERAIESEDRAHSVKVELLRFLMLQDFSPTSHVKKAVNLLPALGQRSQNFPYIRVLLLVDTRGALDTIAMCIDSLCSSSFRPRSESMDDWVDGGSTRHGQAPNLQDAMVDLASILLPKSLVYESVPAANLRGEVDAFLDFAAKYVINGTVHFEKPVTFMILSRVARQYASVGDISGRQMYQRKIMDILSALPRDSYDPDSVLSVFKRSGMHRSALLLHQQVASSWHDDEQDDVELRSRHFLSAIDCYVEDEDVVFRLEVFNYVRKECSGVSDVVSSEESTQPTSVRQALFTRLPVLVQLDPLMTARLVAELFIDDLDRVIASLESRDGKRQFLFLQAIVSGDLVQADPVAGSVLNLSMEHHHTYLALMATQHPEMMYDYLSTHDNYRTEEALRLCEAFDIADASAYLLERMGKVTNALQLILQTMETRMMGLKRSIRSLSVDTIRSNTHRFFSSGRNTRPSTGSMSAVLPSKHESDVAGVRRILVVALDVCERNSGAFGTTLNEPIVKFSHGELWFSVLDRLINAKGFLRLSKEQPEHAKVMASVLSELLHLTMERMVSSVPLSDLVRKVTSDHSGSQIGELREMVQGLLATYGFELNVCKGAIAAFRDDVKLLRHSQVKQQVHGDRVHSVMNAVKHDSISYAVQETSVLRVSGNGNATLVEHNHSAQRAESGLLGSIERLRTRRSLSSQVFSGNGGGASVLKAKNPYRGSVDINMMTMTDQRFRDHESEPVLFGERSVGVLGPAEHRGRLVTFNNF